MRRIALALGLALFATAGCHATGSGRARGPFRPPPHDVPSARARFDGGGAAAVLRAAVEVLKAEGLSVSACGPTRVATRSAELDLPCETGACLTRESVVVRVGYRMATVEVSREAWNATARTWDRELSEAAIAGTLRREETLLMRILQAREGYRAPLQPAECDSSTPSTQEGSASN